jgi:predicted acylesterase/phospholipase RssA
LALQKKDKKEEEKMKTGFCFTGEGARGAIQAGIALGLHNQGINADFTIGISSGSICAASYAYLGPKGLAEMWSNVNNIFDVFGINYNLIGKTGLLNQKPMQKILQKAMENEPICESVVIRMNIEDGYLDYVSNKDVSSSEFAEAVLGSVAITALVEDRNGWVDAGSRQIAPLDQCIRAGCDNIYVIMGRPLHLPPWQKPKGLFKLFNMAFRAFDITLYEIMIRDINSCIRDKSHPDFKNVNIFLVEPKELFYESVEFAKCKQGVVYGTTEFSKHDKKGLRKFIK